MDNQTLPMARADALFASGITRFTFGHAPFTVSINLRLRPDGPSICRLEFGSDIPLRAAEVMLSPFTKMSFPNADKLRAACCMLSASWEQHGGDNAVAKVRAEAGFPVARGEA